MNILLYLGHTVLFIMVTLPSWPWIEEVCASDDFYLAGLSCLTFFFLGGAFMLLSHGQREGVRHPFDIL